MRKQILAFGGLAGFLGAALLWRMGYEAIKIGGACVSSGGSAGHDGCTGYAGQAGPGLVMTSAALAFVGCLAVAAAVSGFAGWAGRRMAPWFTVALVFAGLAWSIAGAALQENLDGGWVPSVAAFCAELLVFSAVGLTAAILLSRPGIQKALATTPQES